ncbi:MAG: Era-like GTP-binding protein [Candidatus Thermoplasmatota archaeon]|nr:Era-like GTP-binding protein [Candidatus Thermoplasmatota archaeon]
MGIRERFKKGRFARWLKKMFGRSHAKIGIYGPPNSGKTTLANKITKDWTGEELWAISNIPHETRRVNKRENVTINNGKGKLEIDIVDTPGIATRVDYREFQSFGLSEDEARARAKEATEGVIEAIRWLDDIDGVLLVLDSCEDPYTQVNITIMGNLEARNIPVLIVANKIDLPQSSPNAIQNAFPQHRVVSISALDGKNIEELYRGMFECFG